VGKELEIEICDDGAGFNPQTVQPGHYGLVGMRERVRLAGGRLDIRSEAGQGTCILLHFPLENGAQATGTVGEVAAGSRIKDTAAGVILKEKAA
jgi:nitrate/nitrite-specific signal transduction histidine kinase